MKLNTCLILFFFNSILSSVIKNCEVGSYCGTEKYGCSVYGNCNFKIFDYYKENSTDEDKLPYCECNSGYSSFDITDLKNENSRTLCCYKKKGLLTAFFLELFLGIGIGHFYLGNYIFGLIKLLVQIFLCVVVFCVAYFACTNEHSFQSNEINNNENINKNALNENKNENKNENNEKIDENENDNDNDSNEKKNNDSKNQSFELEENRENEIMFQNFVSCPKSMLVIYLAAGLYFSFYIVDICLIAFGFFKDGNGEELFMWY